MNNNEVIGQLTCMINSMGVHIDILKSMGYPTKQAENYKASLEMQLDYINNCDESICNNYYGKEN